jgi:hypothetical protein
MKWTGSLALTSALVCAVAVAWAEQEDLTVHLALDLVDGCYVVGIPSITYFPVETSFGKVKVPVEKVRSVEVRDPDKTVSLHLNDGDRVTGILLLDAFKLNTILGKLSIGIEHVRSARVAVLEQNWVSRDATYVPSSVHYVAQPLPSLLTCEGKLYGDQGDKFAFCTKDEDNPHIIIDLGEMTFVKKVHIENRPGWGSRTVGLTVWLSCEENSRGEKVWSTEEAANEYTALLREPRLARYITMGLERRSYFHLVHVRVYGRKRRPCALTPSKQASAGEPPNQRAQLMERVVTY